MMRGYELGPAFRRLREGAGLGPSELAEALRGAGYKKMKEELLEAIEIGKRVPTLEELVDWLRFCGASFVALQAALEEAAEIPEGEPPPADAARWIGPALGLLRREADLEVEELVDRLTVRCTPEKVERWEQGAFLISPVMLREALRHLGLTFADLEPALREVRPQEAGGTAP